MKKTGIPANSRGPWDTYEHRYMELECWNRALLANILKLLAIITVVIGVGVVLAMTMPPG